MRKKNVHSIKPAVLLILASFFFLFFWYLHAGIRSQISFSALLGNTEMHHMALVEGNLELKACLMQQTKALHEGDREKYEQLEKKEKSLPPAVSNEPAEEQSWQRQIQALQKEDLKGYYNERLTYYEREDYKKLGKVERDEFALLAYCRDNGLPVRPADMTGNSSAQYDGFAAMFSCLQEWMYWLLPLGALLLTAGVISGARGSGSIKLLLQRPVQRSRLYVSLLGRAGLWSLALVAALLLGAFLGATVVNGPGDPRTPISYAPPTQFAFGLYAVFPELSRPAAEGGSLFMTPAYALLRALPVLALASLFYVALGLFVSLFFRSRWLSMACALGGTAALLFFGKKTVVNAQESIPLQYTPFACGDAYSVTVGRVVDFERNSAPSKKVYEQLLQRLNDPGTFGEEVIYASASSGVKGEGSSSVIKSAAPVIQMPHSIYSDYNTLLLIPTPPYWLALLILAASTALLVVAGILVFRRKDL